MRSGDRILTADGSEGTPTVHGIGAGHLSDPVLFVRNAQPDVPGDAGIDSSTKTPSAAGPASAAVR